MDNVNIILSITRCYALVCVLFLFCGETFAQDGQRNVTDVNNQISEKSADRVIPDASKLKVNWWFFFQGSPSDLPQRVQEFESKINAQQASLPPDKYVYGNELREQIIANLYALVKTQEKTLVETSITAAIKETYTIQSWLELENLYRNKKKEITDEKADISYLSEALNGVTKQYDIEVVSYLNLDNAGANKFILGMEIMAIRTTLELTKQYLSNNRKVLNNLTQELSALYDEKKAAKQRLVAVENAIPKLNEQLRLQEQALIKVSIELNTIRSSALGAISRKPKDLSTHRLQEQRVIDATVNKAIATLNVIITRNMIALTSLLSNNEVDLTVLKDQLDTWQEIIERISIQHDEWREKTLREQNRAQSRLLNLSASNEQIKLLNEQRNQLTQNTLLNLQNLMKLHANVTTLIDVSSIYLAKHEGGIEHWLITMNDLFKSSWGRASNFFTNSLFKIDETPVTILGLFRVVFILGIAVLFSSFLRRMLAKIAERNDGENSAFYTVGRLAHYLILLIGIVIALSSIGLDFSNLALVAGALSVGIGFGLQSIVNNFVSGLILLFERSLKTGDFIELDSGVRGVVMEINVRSTLINTNDNVDIIVPNSELVSAKVTNWTLRDATRRMRIPFGVAYGTDKDKVKKAVLEAADRVPETLRSTKIYDPQVWLVSFGDSSLDFELIVWVSQAAVKRPSGIAAAYMWEIESSLNQYEIEIPFPQRDLHIRSVCDKNDLR